MKKTLIVALSAFSIAGYATGSFAAKTANTPFSDNLNIQLNGFPTGTVFYANYTSDNGVNIGGPDFFNTDNPVLVTIASNNKVENGYPSMNIVYPSFSGTQRCQLNLIDGPWTVLNYKTGSAPVCPGITVSAITATPGSQYSYDLTITDNEP